MLNLQILPSNDIDKELLILCALNQKEIDGQGNRHNNQQNLKQIGDQLDDLSGKPINQ